MKNNTSQTTKHPTDMEKKSNFRSRVMKQAYQLWLTTRQSWRDCMRDAWGLYRLAKRMRESVVEFRYLKADGTIRKAKGTLAGIPEGATLNGKRLTKPSYKTFAYFDVEKNAFRCFRIENLISVAI